METILFDEKLKAELVVDVKNYLDPATRKFYTQRGIPYRRGYLLHGPAGTGKTSLSIALAGLFGLELYLIHVPSVEGDAELERLFTALPPQCFVLLEDIDAVGIKNRGSFNQDHDGEAVGDEDDDDNSQSGYRRTSVTLSCLLNVLDGVAPQEGRIVLMTSNFAERLDRALVRPGRIDRKIFLGNISPRSAELMFKRMYEHEQGHSPTATKAELEVLSDEQLDKLSSRFSLKIKDDTFTPAQLQGYLLIHRSDPQGSIEGLDLWMEEEPAEMEDAKRRSKEAALSRMRRKQTQLNVVLGPQMEIMEPENTTAGLLGAQQINGVATPLISA